MAAGNRVGNRGAPWPPQEQEAPLVRVEMDARNNNRHNPGAMQPRSVEQQHFEDLNQAINTITDVDLGNTVAVRNPALSGNLRFQAKRKTRVSEVRAKHYHAKTTYTVNYTYITLYILSILASLIYIGIRVYYIWNGFMRQEIPSNTMVVDTTTCAANTIDSDECSNLSCGKKDALCDTISAGDLLASVGIGLKDEITPNTIGDDEQFKGIREIMETHTYSYWWSLIVLAAEIGGFVLVHLSQQMFIRQDTRFYEMAPERVQQLMQITRAKGALQRINIMVCTYNEPMETVKACIDALLASPAPCYVEKVIYVGDDGAKKKFPVSDQKRIMCDVYAQEGYSNVLWVGDRKSLPHQLNGKSSNINHMVLRKMYPHVTKTSEVPFRDVLMVMDCDHLVEPEFFAKSCAVMLDRNVAVCLVPQSFHNEVHPDCFDNTNYNFMFRLMPYYFGAGCCFVTGTNVMIRARAAFMACRFDENPHGHETMALPGHTQKIIKDTLGGDAHRQLFSEMLVAEDIDLGSRVHTLGFKSVFLAEVLAKGEVPRDARSIWKQRSRWASAAHMYILDPSSVFWRPQKNMSYWQKSLYWIPLILHWTLIWAEPVMFSMPVVCLVGNICPYGIDPYLWMTHFAKLVTTFSISCYADSLELSRAAIYGQTMSRVLFFVNVKAVLNTMMVYTGWKRPGAFKVTQKAGGAPAGGEVAIVATPAPPPVEIERDGGGPSIPKMLKSLRMHRIHDSLSKVSEKRKACMPFEGTFDFWVLLGITLMNLFAVGYGVYKLIEDSGNPLVEPVFITLKGCQSQNVQLIALVFAFIEATPGLLFLMYMFVEARAEWVMHIWVPVVIGTISILCIFIEVRVGVQYIGQLFGLEEFFGDSELCGNVENRS